MTDTVSNRYRFVLLGVPDIRGTLRGKVLTAREFDAVLERGYAPLSSLFLALDPADQPITSLRGFDFVSGASDLWICPEPHTLAPLVWRPGWGICIGSVAWPDGTPCELSTRVVLDRVLHDAAVSGLTVRAAFEYEVRIREAVSGAPLTPGPQYSIVDAARLFALVEGIEEACAALGFHLQAVHTEAGPGLVEFNLVAADGIRAADDAVLFKTCLKQMAAGLGLRASFLAKPVAGQEGSSGHLHVSMWDKAENAFARGDVALYALSTTMASALAGLLGHLPGLSLVFGPTINSYKRVIPGYFAPVNVSWGIDNRSTAVRAICSTPSSTRLEIRRPGADANPYLVLAGAVAAMGSGISRQLSPPPPYESDAYVASPDEAPDLPNSLEAAVAAFRADTALTELLGKSFSDYFATTAQWEIDAWQRTVTDWERERYEPVI